MQDIEQDSLPIIRAVREQGAEAVTARALDRAEADRQCFNAFCALNPHALDEARAADIRRANGRVLSALDGVPIAVKDNLLTAGIRTTWGAGLYRNFIPDHDELPIERLRASGAIIIGKTNTPPFSARGYTRNALWGVTRNPLDRALSPGGSSGGSAAAIAAGIIDFALGTDGGGSTRRPAAHCGIVGLKPSIGFIPRGGGFLPLMRDLEVVGPLARDMAHLGVLTAIMAGPDRRDPKSLLRAAPAPQGPLRIGLLTGFDGHPVDPDIRAAVGFAARRLAELGHRIEEVAPFFQIDEASVMQDAVTDAGFAALAAQEPDFMATTDEEYIAQAEAGKALGTAGIVMLHERIDAFRALCGEWFGEWDVLLTPAVAAQAWPIENEYPPVIDSHPVGGRGHAVFTGWVNLAGLPALSLPTGRLAQGLPVGMQIIAGHGRDALLLELGRTYEASIRA